MGRELNKAVTVGQLSELLKLELRGDPRTLIHRIDAANESRLGSLCFAKSESWARAVGSHAVLLTSVEHVLERSGPTLLSSRPRFDFARALSILERMVGFVWASEQAEVHPSVRIGHNVVLGCGVKIGEGTVINHNVVIGDEVVIGNRCVIKSGAVIGEEGFGFERASNGRATRLPHLGTVLIGDDVEVGSLTTVCRGTLGNTLLRSGCKVDDHVHIAHNVDIGEDAFIIACAEVSGGVKIGQRAWIAPNAALLNQITVGSDAIVGLGAVVVKSVTDGSVVAGNPARPLNR